MEPHRAGSIKVNDDEERDVPAWSGIPVFISSEIVMVPIHCSDTRYIITDGWTHESTSESAGGDVEYHFYRRT